MASIRTDPTTQAEAEALRRGELALEEAASRGLPPEPRVYELFYAYVCAEDPDLVEAVDKQLPVSGGPNMDAVERIFEDYLAMGDRAARLLDLGEQMERELSGLHDCFDRANAKDDAFREELARHRDGMSILMRPGSVRQTIRELIEVTSRHIRQTETHLAQLAAARAQINDLSGELHELREEAHRDHLTGLYNRRRFDQELARCCAAMDETAPVSLVLVDIDHFKRINDMHGHAVGDSVLKQVARLLTQNVQGKDTAARHGGEEFALILPQTKLLGARHVAERVRQELGARAFVIAQSRKRLGAITASLGVAQQKPGESPQQLFERADKALYQAKKTGRNRVIVAE